VKRNTGKDNRLLIMLATIALIIAGFGLEACREEDPLALLLEARSEYDVQLHGFSEKQTETGELECILLDMFVINDSDLNLNQLTVKVLRFGPQSDEIPLEWQRIVIDVGEITTNRSSHVTGKVFGMELGIEDALGVQVELNPPREDYDQFVELEGKY